MIHIEVHDNWIKESVAAEDSLFTKTPCEFTLADVLTHAVSSHAIACLGGSHGLRLVRTVPLVGTASGGRVAGHVQS